MPVLVVLVTICSASASAADNSADWILTSADFRAERVSLKSVDAAGAHVTTSDGATRTITLDQFLQLDRAAPMRASGARFILCLTDGQRIAGEPVAVAAEVLRWNSGAFGEVQSPLRRVTAIVRPGVPPTVDEPAEPQTQDVIQLANGDQIRGIVTDVTPEAISVQPAAGGDATAVPLDNVLAARFAKIGAGDTAATQPRPRTFRVSLVDESSISGRDLALDGQTLRLTLPQGPPRQIALAAVSSIEQLNGPVIWLSSLTPIENVQTPYFGGEVQPARFDRTVSGDPIRIGAREFTRGIGVHSYSRLVFAIDPEFARAGVFRTQYAVDGSQPWADVTVRVKLDDRVVYEKPNVRTGSLSPVVMLDLNGARKLTLEVDYGENYDVQDRFNWIEPALLRTKPAPPPPPPTTNTISPATAP